MFFCDIPKSNHIREQRKSLQNPKLIISPLDNLNIIFKIFEPFEYPIVVGDGCAINSKEMKENF
jgi:hypothetical protein